MVDASVESSHINKKKSRTNTAYIKAHKLILRLLNSLK